MPIRFRCDQCNSKLSISSGRAGTSAECPACKKTLTVPRESTLPAKTGPATGGSSRDVDNPNRPEKIVSKESPQFASVDNEPADQKSKAGMQADSDAGREDTRQKEKQKTKEKSGSKSKPKSVPPRIPVFPDEVDLADHQPEDTEGVVSNELQESAKTKKDHAKKTARQKIDSKSDDSKSSKNKDAVDEKADTDYRVEPALDRTADAKESKENKGNDIKAENKTEIRPKDDDRRRRHSSDNFSRLRIQTETQLPDGPGHDGDGNPLDEFAVYDEPVLIIDADEPVRSAENVRIDHDRLAVPRRVIYMQGALLGMASLFFFSLGWWLGSSGSGNSQPAAQAKCEVTGSIYFQSDQGRQIDSGAVVMFLPTDRSPQTRPNAEQLMPGEVLTSANDSVQIIRELGGEVGSVSATGKFSINLPSNRSYYMCVLSKHERQPAGSDVEITNEVRGEMSTFFRPIESLTSRHKFHWETVTLQGKRKSIRDVVF